MAPLVSGLDGGRVLSLGYGLSPRMTEFMASGRPGVELGSFFLYRQVLNPFTNVLDDVELAGGPDLHSFIPNEPMIRPGAYRPEAIGGVTRELRNAAVTRVVSLDPIDHPEFALQAEVATGLPGFAIHVYALADPWPRAYVACRVAVEPDPRRASQQALAEGFDPRRDVVLAQKRSWRRASAEPWTKREVAPGDEGYTRRRGRPRGARHARQLHPELASDDRWPAGAGASRERPASSGGASGRAHDVRVFYDSALPPIWARDHGGWLRCCVARWCCAERARRLPGVRSRAERSAVRSALPWPWRGSRPGAAGAPRPMV